MDKQHILAKNDTLKKALKTLDEAVTQTLNPLMRDGAIQRFEYCFELAWKTIKLAVEYEDKETLGSPRAVLQKAIVLGILQDEEEWFRMLMERNNSVHTYREELATEIANNLSANLHIMTTLARRIEERYQ